MSKTNLKELVLTAMFAALVAVATMVINIPMIATRGFINVGDTIIFVAGVFMGPRVGLLAGGIGSALADLLLGYIHWAPWTLPIKGIEGLLAGLIAHGHFQSHRRLGLPVLIGMLVASAWMVLGYYVAGGIMRGFAVSWTSVPGNIIQGLGSAVIAVPLIHAFRKVDFTGSLLNSQAK